MINQTTTANTGCRQQENVTALPMTQWKDIFGCREVSHTPYLFAFIFSKFLYLVKYQIASKMTL